MNARSTTCLVLALIVAVPFVAGDEFPGLKSVLTAQEWAQAGLDRLTPAELGVIDAALVRHSRAASDRTASGDGAEAAAPNRQRTLIGRFGLPPLHDVDWRGVPPLRARVVAWEGGNRFRLDNGQVWEGFDRIPFDLPGREIEIQARPNHQFALALDGRATTVRIFRLR